jgi:hypothetical protein
LLVDVVLMATANILIFSLWYWIVDSPGMKEIPRVDEPWEFLFPSAQAPFRTMNPGFRVTAIRRSVGEPGEGRTTRKGQIQQRGRELPLLKAAQLRSTRRAM